MRFVSTEQHSLEQIAQIERAAFRDNLTIREGLVIATQLVIHGSERADPFLQFLKSKVRHPDALDYLDKLTRLSAFVQSLKYLPEVKSDTALVSKLYEMDGYVFLRGARQPEKLLVVFTTMYNNFQISNVTFYALLKEFGVSVLMLKDCTYFNFLNGVTGLGADIDSLAAGIAALARANDISGLYLTGFSSGGYASLYASMLLPCSGYMGFSVVTDLTKGSPIFPGKFFTDAIRKHMNEKYLVNLRTLADATNDSVPRELFYGADIDHEKAHALNMAGVPNLKITEIENCRHQTVAALIETGRFADCLRKLLFQA